MSGTVPRLPWIAAATDRAVVSVAGPDAESFLQSLLTNDVSKASSKVGVYAALLTPQGKFLVDMIVWRPDVERFFLDCAETLAADLTKRLTLYKLRAAVDIKVEDALGVVVAWGAEALSPSAASAVTRALESAAAPACGVDPRDPRLGLRSLAPRTLTLAEGLVGVAAPGSPNTWDALRLRCGVPAAGEDLRPNDGYPLEYGFERLNGVDYRKGCFVGQEIVARMKHKTELKKGLFVVRLEGAAPPPGAEVLAAGRPAGSLGSVRDGLGLAHLRYDRVQEGPLTAGDATLHDLEKLAP